MHVVSQGGGTNWHSWRFFVTYVNLHQSGANIGFKPLLPPVFLKILEIALNPRLNLPLRIVRQPIKVTGEAHRPKPKCNCLP
jgi:hypothetical protein